MNSMDLLNAQGVRMSANVTSDVFAHFDVDFELVETQFSSIEPEMHF